MAKKDEQVNLRLIALKKALELNHSRQQSYDQVDIVKDATAFFDFLNVDIVKEKQDDRKALADATVEKYAETKKPATKKPALVEKTMAAKSEMKEPVETEVSTIDYDKQVRPATLTFASANGRKALAEIFTVFGIKKNASELKPAQYADYLEALKNYGGEEEAVA